MESKEISKIKALELAAAAKEYITTFGENADHLSWACKETLECPPNEKMLKKHDKEVAKLTKEAQREARNASNNHAMVYTEGEKKGSFILNEKGDKIFTKEATALLALEIDELNDKYEGLFDALLEGNIDFHIQVASMAPESLPVKFKNSLALLIPKSVAA